MKESRLINLFFTLIALLYLFCCIGAALLRIGGIADGQHLRYMAFAGIAGTVFAAAYLLLYLLLFQRIKLKTGVRFNILGVIVLMPVLVLFTKSYVLDFVTGCTEFQTQIYRLPVGGWQTEPDGEPLCIEPSCKDFGFLSLPVTEEIYIDLTENNPYDKTLKVYDETFDENVYPHLHPIIIRFYERTNIIDSIQIVYEQ